MIGQERASLNSQWGLDHGTWSVLKWMFPDADVAVVQLSIDRSLSPRQHFELAKSLGELRHQGLLLLGSGNIVHNLRHAFSQWKSNKSETPSWASDFDKRVISALAQRETESLLAIPDDDTSRLAHPTIEHWLPLLYVVANMEPNDDLSTPITGFDMGSISMRSVVCGA